MDTTTETKEPLALLVKGRTPEEIVAYACGKCGIVARSEAEARQCHAPPTCSECGAPSGRHRVCDACRAKADAKRNAERAADEAASYAKANKVALADYHGEFLYLEGIGDRGSGDGYAAVDDLDDLFDECEGDGEEPPAWLWSCVPVKIRLNADEIIRSACENQEMHEDAEESVSGTALKEMQAYLDAWCEKNSPTSYTPSYKTAVDVSAALAEFRARRGSAGGEE